jgi:hypothetical protein
VGAGGKWGWAEFASAGLDALIFPATTSDGASYPQGGAAAADQSHTYSFNTNSDFSGAAAVVARDRAGNERTAVFNVLRDGDPPSVVVNATLNGTAIDVSWNAQDAGVGLADCQVEVRAGEQSWQPLADTCVGTTTYTGVGSNIVYTFRLVATDRVGNEGQDQASASLDTAATKYRYTCLSRGNWRRGRKGQGGRAGAANRRMQTAARTRASCKGESDNRLCDAVGAIPG